MRDRASQVQADEAQRVIREQMNIPDSETPAIGVVLGTGWGDALCWDRGFRSIEMRRLPGFGQARKLEGHKRNLSLGFVGGVQVIALQGRFHLNEAPPCDATIPCRVRLQIEMLMKLGVETLILTAAAGSLRTEVKRGDMTVVDGFVSVYAPPMPLFAGEFCSPEDTLNRDLRQLASECVQDVCGRVHVGGHAMVRGPNFEGRKYDKAVLRASGASTVGMSMLPEACIAALYGVEVVALTFVTNDDAEPHSHATNQERARERSGHMGRVLAKLIARLANPPAPSAEE